MTQVPDSGQDAPSAPVLADPAQIVDTFSRARAMTASDVVGGAANGVVVKISGVAAPGPNGPLRAPLSGLECVWYRSYVFQDVIRHGLYATNAPMRPLNEFAPSDLPDYATGPRARGGSGERFGSDRSSVVPFGISDGQSTVGIDPRVTDMDSNVFGINRVVRRPDSEQASRKLRPDELHAEWVIPVGAQILAIGTVTQQGPGNAWLVASAQDVLLVSTKPEQQILSRNQTAIDGPHLPFGRRRR